MKDLLKGVSLMINSTIRIQLSRTVYFDPYRIEGRRGDADYIFITHSHDDHLSVHDIKKLMNEQTLLIAPETCVDMLTAAGFDGVFTVLPDNSYKAGDLEFSTVPMYNTNKRFHGRQQDWVGYIVNIDGVSYYFAGDTDVIPEMGGIRTDVAFLPVGGTYTMDAQEAVEAAGIIKPKVAVPIHYGDVAGTKEDAVSFISRLDKSIKGVLLK